MRQYIKLLVIVFISFIFSSCNVSPDKDKEAINSYLASKYPNSAFKYKIQSIEEVKVITVGDSVIYLTSEYKKLQQPMIERLQEKRAMLVESVGTMGETKQNEVSKQISLWSQTIDSLMHSVPSNIEKYRNKDPNMILLRVLKCSYDEIRENEKIGTKKIMINLSNDGSII